MDSLTQIVLGASVAECTLGKKIGNKAVVWGAVLGTIPDLDVLGTHFLDTVDGLAFHRGFMHSIFFSILFSPVMGWVMKIIHAKEGVSLKEWSVMAFLCLVTHPLLDCFTTWGTQLFWPFDYRVAFSSVFVIDPVYTLPFLFLLVISLFYKREASIRRRLNTTGLVLSTTFLGLTLVNKAMMTSAFLQEAQRQNLPITAIEVRPAPLQNILWTANLKTENGYYIGYRSFLDDDDTINFQFYPKNAALLTPFAENDKLNQLLKITKGWYTVTQYDSTHYAINDLRFGVVDGIRKTSNDFVFSYTMIVAPDKQLTFEQKQYKFGKDVGKATFKQLWARVKGVK